MENITLVKHNIAWENEFEKESELLMSTFRGMFLKVHHVGSTAVPDLLTKPIIDISVESLEFPPLPTTIQLLTQLGYAYHGECGVKGRIWFTKGIPRKFNLHLCAVDSIVTANQVMFRDQLRYNEQLRRVYEKIKIKNCDGRDIDDIQYALSKSDLIDSIIKAENIF